MLNLGDPDQSKFVPSFYLPGFLVMFFTIR